MYKLKKRCIRCYHVLREDGTCQNPDCVRYTPEKGETTSTSNDSSIGTDAKEKAN